MHIGLVLDDTLDTPDGVQQYVLNVGSWLSSQGHEVHYLVGSTMRTDIANIHSLSHNVRVTFNGNTMSMPLPVSRRRLGALLADLQLDVIHVQVPYSPFLAGRVIRLVPKTTAVIGTFHILPYSTKVRLANRGLALLNHRSGARFDQMLAVSEPAKQFATAVYGYRATRVVPNPVHLEQFNNAVSSDQNLNIVFLGRLVERKGAGLLLAAVAELRRRNLYGGLFQLHIGGKGPLLKSLQTMTRDYQLSDIVRFDGFIDEAAKANYLAAADIAVFPSTSGESFGIVLLEAMAAARGVVLAGNNPGYSSVMESLSQQLFDPTNVTAFADILGLWLRGAAARQQASARQKEYIQQFDVSIVGSKIEAIYVQALQSRQ